MAAIIQANIMADSINPYTGKRLVTWNLRYPRMMHSEVMTHRVFARNAESSRARPVAAILAQIEDEPYIPIEWGQNQKGMSAGEPVSLELAAEAEEEWLAARDDAVRHARKLADIGLHKQWANRLLEPFAHISVILSSTEWNNYYDLRCDKDTVLPEFYKLATLMRDQMEDSKPVERLVHIPFVHEWERIDWLADSPWQLEKNLYACMVAVGRLCRVSYLTHEGIRDPQADINLCKRLISDKHMSPFEHVAFAIKSGTPNRGCFSLWRQFRQLVEDGCVRI